MEDNSINIPRGTSLGLGITVLNADGTEHDCTSETIRFGVKADPNDSDFLISKTADYDSENECYVVAISPSDTANLPYERDWYDIGLQSGTDYYMLVEASAFNVTKAITKAVSGS